MAQTAKEAQLSIEGAWAQDRQKDDGSLRLADQINAPLPSVAISRCCSGRLEARVAGPRITPEVPQGLDEQGQFVLPREVVRLVQQIQKRKGGRSNLLRVTARQVDVAHLVGVSQLVGRLAGPYELSNKRIYPLAVRCPPHLSASI